MGHGKQTRASLWRWDDEQQEDQRTEYTGIWNHARLPTWTVISSLKFKEISQELKHPTLSNEGSQETRWVRANLSATQTFFRNLPTLYTLIGREESSYAESGDIPCQKSMEKKRDELSRAETIAFAVGITQLLDCYSVASLNAQHLPFFPTTMIKSVLQLQKNLQLWKNNWMGAEYLQFAGTGCPVNIINNLKSGTYKLDISDHAKTNTVHRVKLNIKHHNYNITELKHDWDAVNEFFDTGFQTTEITVNDVVVSEIPITNLTDEKEAKATAELQAVC